jgi:hypothetical protein
MVELCGAPITEVEVIRWLRNGEGSDFSQGLGMMPETMVRKVKLLLQGEKFEEIAVAEGISVDLTQKFLKQAAIVVERCDLTYIL